MPSSEGEKILASLIKHMMNEDEDPLTPLLDEYYMTRHRSKRRLKQYIIDMEDRPRPHGRFSPSKLCGCERQAAFSFTGMPGRTTIDPEREGVFEDGKWRHHRHQATFRDMELVLGRKRFTVMSIEEVVEHSGLYIAGSTDAVIRIEGVWWVVDFKGINSWGFERVYRDNAPLRAHVLQLIAYMKLRRIRRGMLMYEHKDQNRTKVFVVKFSRKDWVEVEEWAGNVARQLELRVLPDMSPDCSAGTLLYERCPWAHVCFGNISPAKIQRRMYRNFPGVKEAWEEGKAIVASFT